MERVIVHKITSHLQESNLLNKAQHGFLNRKSTLTNLLETTNDWVLTIQNKDTCSAIYIDFKRAFDMVNHNKLLKKLEDYGICGGLLELLRDLITNRIQATRVGKIMSSFVPIYTGVIQGSCIGPLLFLIFINDITDMLDSSVTVKLYADDLKIYARVKTSTEFNKFQHELNKIVMWSIYYELPISIPKCYLLNIGKQLMCDKQITISDNQIMAVKSAKDLGIIIDQNLQFDEHINEISRKAYSRSNLIFRSFATKNRKLLIKAYTTYVRPILEYNSPIWSPQLIKHISSIEVIQRSYTKRIPGLSNKSYAERLTILKLDSLELRRLIYDLTTLYKILFGQLQSELQNQIKINENINNRSLRRHPYQLQYQSSKTQQSTFIQRTVPIWNSLPHDCSFTDLQNFKQFLSKNKQLLVKFLKVSFQ